MVTGSKCGDLSSCKHTQSSLICPGCKQGPLKWVPMRNLKPPPKVMTDLLSEAANQSTAVLTCVKFLCVTYHKLKVQIIKLRFPHDATGWTSCNLSLTVFHILTLTQLFLRPDVSVSFSHLTSSPHVICVSEEQPVGLRRQSVESQTS